MLLAVILDRQVQQREQVVFVQQHLVRRLLEGHVHICEGGHGPSGGLALPHVPAPLAFHLSPSPPSSNSSCFCWLASVPSPLANKSILVFPEESPRPRTIHVVPAGAGDPVVSYLVTLCCLGIGIWPKPGQSRGSIQILKEGSSFFFEINGVSKMWTWLQAILLPYEEACFRRKGRGERWNDTKPWRRQVSLGANCLEPSYLWLFQLWESINSFFLCLSEFELEVDGIWIEFSDTCNLESPM